MTQKITQAVLLAAGLGTRMRPLTDTLPKPLLPVNGRSMLERALDKCVAAGVQRAVINLHYLGDKIRERLAGRTDIEIIFSAEPEILDTGGGVKQALTYLDSSQPFFCINTDLVWTDGAMPALQRLAQHFNAASMDALMLMVPTDKAVGFGVGKGDYHLTNITPELGRLHGRQQPPPKPYVWVAAQIMNPQPFAAITEKVFSNTKIWDAAEPQGRLFGLIHDAGGFHAGTPEDLATVDNLVRLAENSAK